ncbi:prepilin-type N-terminal cleavage/methylation domain-containing protein [Polaromonas sp. OV174]|uniref:pilus assembly FimT family protein n=1 Tax=Polaromonas sp. OV174 TaxID=1855300 RepID=UPI0008F3ABE4|nr:prepilin-type N-terminal cleavage/methylation domain-containing protein [Polaromonas sp. OV174]SFC10857.1 prepilin-type N-terminal cleavage/methylation domain-containing protein [Polaromonas sp. OV174]
MMARKGSVAMRLDHAPNGITLIETMVVITLLAILAAIAAPSFREMMINRRLEGKAREYVTHMNWAKSLAVSSNQAVKLHIATGESASCYVVFQGPVNDCSCNANGAVCTIPDNKHVVVVLPHHNGVRVSARGNKFWIPHLLTAAER